MSKVSIITVQEVQILVSIEINVDFIYLTDMVKEQESEKLYSYVYEADFLNLVLWECTAEHWREANLGSFNSELLKLGLNKTTQHTSLHKMAQQQLLRLNEVDLENGVRKLESTTKILN